MQSATFYHDTSLPREHSKKRAWREIKSEKLKKKGGEGKIKEADSAARKRAKLTLRFQTLLSLLGVMIAIK